MQSFDFSQRTRFVFGSGTIDLLGSLARELNGSRVLLVSDPGVVKVGHFHRAKCRLEEAGLVVEPFHGLHENPTTTEVDAGLAIARSFRPDLIIGLGGGSSMDCAKGINFVYSCGGSMRDYWGIGKATGPMLPMIAVPTTAGTGSEAQSFALISDAKTHVKMACGDPRAACKVAVLDPELTLTQPPRVTALTGVDALTHALETMVTSRRTPISSAYSMRAWQLMASAFGEVLDRPSDVEARSRMQVGACVAGMAIEASMLGVAHALANPLTARYGIPHGQAVGLMMPHVILFNAALPEIEKQYAIALATVHELGIGSTAELAQWFQKQMFKAGLATCLDELSIEFEVLEDLAEDASKQWTATFNPRPVIIEDLRKLYQQAFSPADHDFAK